MAAMTFIGFQALPIPPENLRRHLQLLLGDVSGQVVEDGPGTQGPDLAALEDIDGFQRPRREDPRLELPAAGRVEAGPLEGDLDAGSHATQERQGRLLEEVEGRREGIVRAALENDLRGAGGREAIWEEMMNASEKTDGKLGGLKD